jgi:hypothetical protein
MTGRFAAVAVAALLTGCGGGDAPTRTVERTVTEEAAEPPAERRERPRRTAKTVPDLVGERLDVAESDLRELGLRYREVGGGAFGIVDASNWKVCETRPAAGAKAKRVKLIVEREC